MNCEALTHALELLLQLSHMLTFSDTEVVIGIIILINTVRRCGSTYCQYGSRALRTLCLSDFLNF
jgi:hypothetical protein